MSKDWYEDIVDFCHDVVLWDIKDYPQIDLAKKELVIKLIKEETYETLEAIDNDDMPEIADGIADSIVVLLDAAIAYGIDMRPIWDVIHKANMAKVGGPIRVDGKRLKPEGWVHPDVGLLLEKQGWIKK